MSPPKVSSRSVNPARTSSHCNGQIDGRRSCSPWRAHPKTLLRRLANGHFCYFSPLASLGDWLPVHQIPIEQVYFKHEVSWTNYQVPPALVPPMSATTLLVSNLVQENLQKLGVLSRLQFFLYSKYVYLTFGKKYLAVTRSAQVALSSDSPVTVLEVGLILPHAWYANWLMNDFYFWPFSQSFLSLPLTPLGKSWMRNSRDCQLRLTQLAKTHQNGFMWSSLVYFNQQLPNKNENLVTHIPFFRPGPVDLLLKFLQVP